MTSVTTRPPIAIPHVAGGHRFWDAKTNLTDIRPEAVEWNLGVARPPLAPGRRKKVIQLMDELAPRHSFHAPATEIELAHKDSEIRQLSRLVMKQTIDFVSEREKGEHITFHMANSALEKAGQLSWDYGVESLVILAEHAKKRGVRLALENVRSGWTGDPDLLLQLATEGGVDITFDAGHAAAGRWVQSGNGTAVDFLRKILPKVITAHLYEIEVDEPRPSTHLPPANMENLAPIVQLLLEAGCPWWTVELPDKAQFLTTYQLIADFVDGLQRG